MRRVLLVMGFCLGLSACRYLVAPTPSVSPSQPGLLSSGNPTEPGRQPNALPENRCGVACGAGFHCDTGAATCVADGVKSESRDGGPAWLP